MGLTEKQNEAFNKVKDKSDDDYEKNIVYIAAGTLVLSMTFLEKIIKVETSTGIWVLICSWSFLALTLLGNLVSHQLASHFSETCIELFDKCQSLLGGDVTEESPSYQETLKVAFKKFDRCNSITRRLNWTTTFTLFIGIALMVVFCSMNAINAKEQNEINLKNKRDSAMSKQIKPQTQETDISKGRTMSPAMRPPSQATNPTTNNGNQGGGNSSQNNQGGK